MLAEAGLTDTRLEIGITNETDKIKNIENKIIKNYSRKIDKLSSKIWEESQRDDISGNFCNTLQDIAKVLRNLNGKD